jgi:hypothetical protein
MRGSGPAPASTVAERLLERAEPVTAEGVERAEVARERAGAAIRADEGVERNRPDARVAAPERLQPRLDLVQLEQLFATAAPEPLHLAAKRITPVRKSVASEG